MDMGINETRSVLYFSVDNILRSNLPSSLVDVTLLDQFGFEFRF